MIDLTIVVDSASQRLLPDERQYHKRGIYTKAFDFNAWDMSYYHGYRKSRYQVPAHRYNTLITWMAVEIVTGIQTMYYPTCPEGFRGPYYDCDLVLYIVSEFPEGFIQ